MQQLSQLLSLLARLQRDETETQERLTQIRSDLEAVRRTVVLLEPQVLGNSQPNIESEDQLLAALKGKTYPEAALLIAQAHHMRVRPSSDKNLLVKAGIAMTPVKGYRQLTSTLCRLMNMQGNFRRVGEGEYELVA